MEACEKVPGYSEGQEHPGRGGQRVQDPGQAVGQLAVQPVDIVVDII